MGNLTALSEGSLQLNYQFDAQGRRIQRSKNGQLTHRWLYLDQLRIAAELNADGSLKQQFAYGEKLNVPSLILRKGQNQTEAYRIISDHLGSVRLVVKVSDGAIMQRMRYNEYGQVLEDTNPGFQPFGYAGGLYDPDSGLVRFGARDYDAEIGRWLAKDPIGFWGSANFYAYVDNDPLNLIDPSGLINIPGIPGATGETSVHANPGPDATTHRPEHGPDHIHLGKNNGPRVRTSDFEPFSDDDARRMSRKQRKFCEALTDEAKDKIRKAQSSIFKHGRALLTIMGGSSSIAASCRADLVWCAAQIEAGGL